MDRDLTIASDDYGKDMQAAGVAANFAALSNVWQDYHDTLAENTKQRQMDDLASYSTYLAAAGISRTPAELFAQPTAWAGTSWGLIKGYVKWSLDQGYAIGTVNVRLATLRQYCTLCGPRPDGVGILTEEQLLMIKTVKGTQGKKARNLDRERERQGIPTRRGHKKAEATNVPTETALQLKKIVREGSRGTAERDHLLMGLLIEQAFRCGEIAGLNIEQIDLRAGTITLYREKTDQQETHQMKRHTQVAAEKYLEREQRKQGPLFMGNKGRRLSPRAIHARVKTLGGLVELETLAPHDLRHFWTYNAFREGTPIDAVKSGGGWKSNEMPLRYARRAGIANAGVRITEEEETQ